MRIIRQLSLSRAPASEADHFVRTGRRGTAPPGRPPATPGPVATAILAPPIIAHAAHVDPLPAYMAGTHSAANRPASGADAIARRAIATQVPEA